MSLVLVGTNHRHSPIYLRERISFPKKRTKDALDFLMAGGALKGAVILSTCNRVEIYASAYAAPQGIEEIKDFICRYHEIGGDKLFPRLYAYEGSEAVRHLFSVACGLDSLVLGETQISGQVRASFLESEAAGFSDGILKEAFRSAMAFAGRARRETSIYEGKVSAGSIAADFLRERAGSLSGKNILVIGVGKITELVLSYLKKEKTDVIFISNRTFIKAERMARYVGGRAVRFDRLGECLKGSDIVITATSSPHVIIRKETLEEAIGFQPSAVSNRLLILDLATPRDVDPRVKELKNVELFCLEDMHTVIKENMRKKARDAEKLKKIIDAEVEEIWRELTKQEPAEARLP